MNDDPTVAEGKWPREKGMAAVQAIDEAVRSVADRAKDFPKLFPFGINKIKVTISATQFEVEIEGPDRAAALKSAYEHLDETLLATRFDALWKAHPYPAYPCNTALFPDQCAIRMTVAFEGAGVSTSSFDTMFPGRRCWENPPHHPKHILAAEEFAKWLDGTPVLGNTSKQSNVTSKDYESKKGVVFFLNMPTDDNKTIDHIDLWNGKALKAGHTDYFSAAAQVWFWAVA